MTDIVINLKGQSWDEQLLQLMDEARSSAKQFGRPNWDKCKRSVAASQPPRLGDIEGHAKFLQKYGGDEINYPHTYEMISCLETAMPEGRIVSGSFMEKIASLKASPKELTPRLAHALVIAQACGEKEREGVGLSITENHVKSLASSNKSNDLRAEAILTKSWEVVTAAHYSQQSINAITDLQRDLVNHIFWLDEQYETIENIFDEFVKNALNLQEEATTQNTHSVSDDVADGPSVVVYSADGNDAGRTTINNLGYKVNDVIERKSSDESKDVQFRIAYTNEDGSSGCRRILFDGSAAKDLTIIEMNDLVKNYRHCKKEIRLLEGYPDNNISESDSFKQLLLKSQVVIALNMLHRSKDFQPIVYRIQKSPKERVFACKSVEKGGLRIVPMTTKVSDFLIKDSTEAHVGSNKFALQRIASNKCASEYFYIRVVHDAKLANMKLQMFKARVDCMNVKIQCAVNTKDIAEDDEIVLFRSKATDETKEKEPKSQLAVLDGPVTKKAKVA